MSDRITNRYFGATVPNMPINFKEFSLAVAPTTHHASSRALWNGGDGYDWIIVRPKIHNIFVSRSLERFLSGTEPITFDVNPPTEQQFVDDYITILTERNIQNRNNMYAALCTRFNLPVIGWGAGAGVDALNPVNQDIFMQPDSTLSQIIKEKLRR